MSMNNVSVRLRHYCSCLIYSGSVRLQPAGGVKATQTHYCEREEEIQLHCSVQLIQFHTAMVRQIYIYHQKDVYIIIINNNTLYCVYCMYVVYKKKKQIESLCECVIFIMTT